MGGANKSCLLRTALYAVTGTFVRVPGCHPMSDDNSTRAGLLSGLFAVIMVVALSIMALTALDPEPQASASRGFDASAF